MRNYVIDGLCLALGLIGFAYSPIGYRYYQGV